MSIHPKHDRRADGTTIVRSNWRALRLLLLMLLIGVPASAQKQYWEQIPVLTDHGFRFTEIECADAMHCVACGMDASSYVFRTTDGGRSWSPIWFNSAKTFPERPAPYNHVLNLQVYDIAHPTPNLIILVADSTRGVVEGTTYSVKEAGVIVRSSDGGASWSYTELARLDIPGYQRAITNIDMSDSLNGIIAQRVSHKLLRTVDGGLSWQEVALPDTTVRYALDVAQPEASTYIVPAWSRGLGRFVVYRTTDAGLAWQSSTDTLPPFQSMRFVSSRLGYAVGEGEGRSDVISRTTDGGLSWQRLVDEMIAPSLGLFDIDCLDSLDCIAGGGGGKILRTRDGWRTWTKEESGFGLNWFFTNVTAVAFPAPETMLGAAVHGYLLRYRREGFVGQTTILLPLSPGAAPVTRSPRIVWRSVEGATAYQVQLSLSEAFTPVDVDRTVIGDTAMIAAGLQPGRVYHLRIRAIGATGPGNWSNPPHEFTTAGVSMSVHEPIALSMGLVATPNPFTGSTRIRLRAGGGATLGLYTMTGRLVVDLSRELSGCSGGECAIELMAGELAPGPYLLRYQEKGVVMNLMLMHALDPQH